MEIEHVKAHCTKKEEEKMTQFEGFVVRHQEAHVVRAEGFLRSCALARLLLLSGFA